MVNLKLIRSKAEFIATLNAKAWEVVGGGPGGPGGPAKAHVFSDAHVELLVADVVRSVSATISDKRIAKQTLALSQKMAELATRSLMADWEPGDELCPPWRWPFPWPKDDLWHPLGGGGDDGEPKPIINSVIQIELASVLTQLSAQTMQAEFNKALVETASSISRGVASQLSDDIERCGTVPRQPFPKPHHAGNFN
ncbi:hypothetical protein [Spirosoma flavum]|uniref:Uncharacterized protein n=1 Tax=Spirosoma flavum TaxID=2048557 RepID=A0ABW6AB72_9BACT